MTVHAMKMDSRKIKIKGKRKPVLYSIRELPTQRTRGVIKLLCNAMGVGAYGSSQISVTNVSGSTLSVLRTGGVQFPEKKRYATLEWPLTLYTLVDVFVPTPTQPGYNYYSNSVCAHISQDCCGSCALIRWH